MKHFLSKKKIKKIEFVWIVFSWRRKKPTFVIIQNAEEKVEASVNVKNEKTNKKQTNQSKQMRKVRPCFHNPEIFGGAVKLQESIQTNKTRPRPFVENREVEWKNCEKIAHNFLLETKFFFNFWGFGFLTKILCKIVSEQLFCWFNCDSIRQTFYKVVLYIYCILGR